MFFDCFVCVICYSGYKQSMTEAGIAAARKEFDLMDRDKDGYIGTDDLINVFTEDENMSPNECSYNYYLQV